MARQGGGLKWEVCCSGVCTLENLLERAAGGGYRKELSRAEEGSSMVSTTESVGKGRVGTHRGFGVEDRLSTIIAFECKRCK